MSDYIDMDKSNLLYKEGVKFIQQEKFQEAIEKIQESILHRNEPSPDMWRNLGWGHYRLGEDALFEKDMDLTQERLFQARECYKHSEDAFGVLLDSRKSADLRERINFRIEDCKKRIIHAEGILEVVQRWRVYIAKDE